MIIKKYQAKTEEEAMKLAVAELGESCVLMNSKVIKRKGIMRLFKAPIVEATVALEEEDETNYEHLINPIKIPDSRPIISGFNQVVGDDYLNSSKNLNNASNLNNNTLNDSKIDNNADGSLKDSNLDIKEDNSNYSKGSSNEKKLNDNYKTNDNDLNSKFNSNDKYSSSDIKSDDKFTSSNELKSSGKFASSNELKSSGKFASSNEMNSNNKIDSSNGMNSNERFDSSNGMNSKDRFDSLNDNYSKDNSSVNNENKSENDLTDNIDAVYDLICQTLIDNEVDEKYVKEIISEAKNRLKNNTPMDAVLAHIYQRLILKFGEPKTIEKAQEGPKVVFFVGTTGVGKTTTIAKLASKLYISGNKVALFTSDTYRIAAAEQLHSYANIMTVPFKVIYTLDEFEDALKDFFEYDYILVDTVGHSHKNEELKANMKTFIDLSKTKAETEVYLVLAASTKMRDLIHISDSYREITDYRLIFTKLDETYTYGTIYNLKMHTDAPLSYITYGQNVPDDIDSFKPQQIVKKLLGGK